jgi:alkylation response protein AidB-like acyl-CoA dehydrogenase
METQQFNILNQVPPLENSHHELRVKAREFAKKYIKPVSLEHDINQTVPWDVLKAAAREGFYTVDFFTELALDPTGLSAAVVAEEFGYADAGIGLTLLYPALPLTTLYLTATPNQLQKILPGILGDTNSPKIISLAASEPEAGSDVSAYKTTAVKQSDGTWLLNGVKRWAGNAPDASILLIVASLDPSLGSKAQLVFILDPKLKGVTIDKSMDKLGLRAMKHADIILKNVVLPASSLLGDETKQLARIYDPEKSALPVSMQTFTATRALVAAMAVGVAASAVDAAVEYAKNRSTFSKAIIEHQQVAAEIADMITKVQAARSLVYKACLMQSQLIPMTQQEGSQAKLFAAKMVIEVTYSALQIAGGLGFTQNLVLEQKYRDAPIFGIFEGTNEIQKLLITSAVAGKKIR